METFTITDLSFIYPGKQQAALSDLDLEVKYGEFIVICGQTGCGKSTLLRNLKSALAPYGRLKGKILFYGRPLDSIDQREQAARIGFVMQDPDNQIVTDKVWHEMAFGLESLGYDTGTIRLRVSEMASFFGIQQWFKKDVFQLSGGQKQVLNLASVMAMHPDVLILDEPTSQLDPIAAGDFLDTLKKINREIGTTVIITEHRLEQVMIMADRVVVLDKGRKIADAPPVEVGQVLNRLNHPMLYAMPAPMQIYEKTVPLKEQSVQVPITVRDGRNWLTELFHDKKLDCNRIEPETLNMEGKPVLQMKDVWFRYGKHEDDVIKGLNMDIPKGKLYCIVGGNGTGKTTALSLMGGILKPYRGSIMINGKKITKHVDKHNFNTKISVLPQNPQALFVEKTVEADLLEVLVGMSVSEKGKKIRDIGELTDIMQFMEVHPYDLSGGEQQRVALAKLLLTDPEILLLDEPTKGLDEFYKERLASIFKQLLNRGKTIVMVSHDIEFCGKYANICAMFFDGSVITADTPHRFFSGNSFYTTAANRMSRHLFENAVTVKDVVSLCRKNLIPE